jgi:succinyl-CoA synthetase alpha subunit
MAEGKGDAPSKIKYLTEAGIKISPSPAQLGKTILEAMKLKNMA